MDRASTPIKFLDLVFYSNPGELRRRGHLVKLPEKPLLALTLLIEQAHRVVTREDLRRRLWPAGTFVEFDDNLNATIKRLRELLGDSADAPRIIETVPRSGYRFIAPIETAQEAGLVPLASPSEPSSPRNSSARLWLLARRVMLAGAPVVALVTLVTLIAPIRVRRNSSTQEQSSRGVVKLGVVSFQNLTGDSDLNFLSNGLADEVAARLRKFAPERLVVVRYEPSYPRSVPGTIGRDLGVDYLLQGSVEGHGGSLSLAAELSDLRNSTPIWSTAFRLPLQEVFVQQDLGDRVARTFSLKAAPLEHDQLSRDCTTNTVAHEAYLRGREMLKAGGDSSVQPAMALFRTALKRDSQYALPYVGLAEAYLRLGKSHILSLEKAEREASWAISQGMALDAAIPAFSLLRAMMLASHPGQDQAAEAAYRQAIALDPLGAMAHAQYAIFLRERRPQAGLAEINRARDLEPLSPWISAYRGALLMTNDNLAAADEQLHAALRLESNSPATLRFLGDLEAKRGQIQQATVWYEKAAAASGRKPFYLYLLGLAYARSGRDLDTKATLQELRRKSRQEFVDPLYIHALEGALGG